MATNIIRMCEYCSNIIPADASKKRRFCSKKCKNKMRNTRYSKKHGNHDKGIYDLTFAEIKMLEIWLKQKKCELLRKYEAALDTRELLDGLHRDQIKQWINEHRREIYGEETKGNANGSTKRERDYQRSEEAAF